MTVTNIACQFKLSMKMCLGYYATLNYSLW